MLSGTRLRGNYDQVQGNQFHFWSYIRRLKRFDQVDKKSWNGKFQPFAPPAHLIWFHHPSRSWQKGASFRWTSFDALADHKIHDKWVTICHGLVVYLLSCVLSFETVWHLKRKVGCEITILKTHDTVARSSSKFDKVQTLHFLSTSQLFDRAECFHENERYEGQTFQF